MNALDRLQQAGALRAIDVEFARLIARLDGRGDMNLALAAAAVSQAVAQGHSCLPLDAIGDVLSASAGEPLRVALPEPATLRAALVDSALVDSTDDAQAAPLVFDGAARLWLRRYFDQERRVAAGLLARANRLRLLADPAALRARIAHWFPRRGAIDWQAVAVALGLRTHLAIISGGPGTGKTTSVLWLLVALLENAQAQGRPLPRIRLAAPTGKAAARLGESIRERKAALDCSEAVRAAIRENETATIHRLLGFVPQAGFRHDRSHPVAADIVVVDEASMVDLPLMARLLDGLADDAALILLGDVDQLASVEAGHVLASIGARGDAANRYSAAAAADLLALTGHAVPRADASDPLGDAFVELQHSHRFGGASGIGRLARAIRVGDADAAVAVLHEHGADLDWHDGALAASALPPAWVAQHRALATAASPQAALAAAARLRILTALRSGPYGCVAINRALETELGDSSGWYHGRLVMITANDYRHGLFNGDVGIAWQSADGRLDVWFAGEGDAMRAFAPYTLPAHEAAFAMTVHKSQGSEFDEVAIVLPDAPNRVLGRELLYTAVTRARMRAVVYGSEAVVRAAVARRIERWSGLAERLREESLVRGGR